MDTPAFTKVEAVAATVKVLPLTHGWNGIRGPPANAKQASMACLEGFTSTVNPNPTPNQVENPLPDGTRYTLLSTPHHELTDSQREIDKEDELEHIGHLVAEIKGPVLGLRSERDRKKAVRHLYAPGTPDQQYIRRLSSMHALSIAIKQFTDNLVNHGILPNKSDQEVCTPCMRCAQLPCHGSQDAPDFSITKHSKRPDRDGYNVGHVEHLTSKRHIKSAMQPDVGIGNPHNNTLTAADGMFYLLFDAGPVWEQVLGQCKALMVVDEINHCIDVVPVGTHWNPYNVQRPTPQGGAERSGFKDQRQTPMGVTSVWNVNCYEPTLAPVYISTPDNPMNVNHNSRRRSNSRNRQQTKQRQLKDVELTRQKKTQEPHQEVTPPKDWSDDKDTQKPYEPSGPVLGPEAKPKVKATPKPRPPTGPETKPLQKPQPNIVTKNEPWIMSDANTLAHMILHTTAWQWEITRAKIGDPMEDLKDYAPGTNLTYKNLHPRLEEDNKQNAGSFPIECFEGRCRPGDPTAALTADAPDYQGMLFLDDDDDIQIENTTGEKLEKFLDSDLTFHPIASAHIVVDTRHVLDERGRTYMGWNIHRDRRQPVLLMEVFHGPQTKQAYPEAKTFPPDDPANWETSWCPQLREHKQTNYGIYNNKTPCIGYKDLLVKHQAWWHSTGPPVPGGPEARQAHTLMFMPCWIMYLYCGHLDAYGQTYLRQFHYTGRDRRFNIAGVVQQIRTSNVGFETQTLQGRLFLAIAFQTIMYPHNPKDRLKYRDRFLLRKALATLRNYFRQDIPMPIMPGLHEPPCMHLICRQDEASSQEKATSCERFLAQVQDYMHSPHIAKHTWTAWQLGVTGAEAHCAVVTEQEGTMAIKTLGIVAVLESLAPSQEDAHRPRTNHQARETQPQDVQKTANNPKDGKTKIPKAETTQDPQQGKNLLGAKPVECQKHPGDAKQNCPVCRDWDTKMTAWAIRREASLASHTEPAVNPHTSPTTAEATTESGGNLSPPQHRQPTSEGRNHRRRAQKQAHHIGANEFDTTAK